MGSRKLQKADAKQVTECDRKQVTTRGVLLVTLAVVTLCAIHYTLALTSVINKSNTYDELAHLTRGYSYSMTGDFRLGPPHPPLAHYWAALAGRGMEVRFPPLDQNAWHESDVWTIGREFFYYRNLGNEAIIDSLLFRGRAMIALLSVGLGLIVFFWSRRLFGTTGGLISLTLFAFSPTMLAHSRLVTTDCAVTLFFVASLGCIWWLLHKVSPASVLCGAAALTCLFLSKMSAVLIIPVGLVLMVIRVIDGRPLVLAFGKKVRQIQGSFGQLTCFIAVMVGWVLITWFGLWAAYGFRYEAMANARPDQDRFYSSNAIPEGKTDWEHQLRSLDHLAPTIGWLREHRLLPEAYIYSAAFSAQTARGRSSFLNGDVALLGHSMFFPYTFVAKTPLPLFGMLVLAAAVPIATRRRDNEKAGKQGQPDRKIVTFLYKTSPLWVFFAAYWIVTLRSNLNIGHRHILPTYPLLFIICGATAYYWQAHRKTLKVVASTCLGLFVIAGLSIYPNYLSYFNLLAGGPDNGYLHLVDSSLDWGQDLPGLKSYIDNYKNEGFEGQTYVSYFGSGGQLALDHFGIESVSLPHRLQKQALGDYGYKPGLYAISATNFQQVYQSIGKQYLLDWDQSLEDYYWKLNHAAKPFFDAPDNEQARARFDNKRFRTAFNTLERLKFARLCAYLRAKQPDHIVNHSILIFDLDQEELDAALTGSIELVESLAQDGEDEDNQQ